MQLESGRSLVLDVGDLSTRRLVGEIASTASRLARKEVELAKAELRADLRAELTMATGLAVALVASIAGVTVLLMAAVLALANVMPGWLAALVVGSAVLAVGAAAGLYGWSRRVRGPLTVTRRTLEEDLQWAKQWLS